MDYTISVADPPDEEFGEFLYRSIREYNDAHSPHHLESRRPGARWPLQLVAKTPDGQCIGGLTAEIYWGWLDVRYFILREDYRKMGIGTAVLQRAEAIARAKGCTKAFLTTFEFQGRTFYERHGYHVAGKLEGYPPGSSYYWMEKSL